MPDELPYGMQEDVEISFTIEGAASEVLAELRRLARIGRTRRRARIRAVTIRPGGRGFEDRHLPEIVEGDAGAAKETLAVLVRQRLVSADQPSAHGLDPWGHLDEVIGALEILTRPF